MWDFGGLRCQVNGTPFNMEKEASGKQSEQDPHGPGPEKFPQTRNQS